MIKLFRYNSYALSIYTPLAGVESYHEYLSWLPQTGVTPMYIIALFPIFFIPILIEQLFYNSVFQSQLQRYSNWFVGIVVIGISFGLLHVFTPPSPDYNYGFITFILGLMHAWLYHRYRNVLAPTLFLTLHLIIVMFLLAI